MCIPRCSEIHPPATAYTLLTRASRRDRSSDCGFRGPAGCSGRPQGQGKVRQPVPKGRRGDGTVDVVAAAAGLKAPQEVLRGSGRHAPAAPSSEAAVRAWPVRSPRDWCS